MGRKWRKWAMLKSVTKEFDYRSNNMSFCVSICYNTAAYKNILRECIDVYFSWYLEHNSLSSKQQFGFILNSLLRSYLNLLQYAMYRAFRIHFLECDKNSMVNVLFCLTGVWIPVGEHSIKSCRKKENTELKSMMSMMYLNGRISV